MERSGGQPCSPIFDQPKYTNARLTPILPHSSAAFAPDKGESVESLINDPPSRAPVPPILPPVIGYLFLDREKFPASFAGNVGKEQAQFMADSQVRWGLEALGGKITDPAWKHKPSWYSSLPTTR